MSQQQEPIWVESLLTAQEHVEMHKKYPNTVTRSKPVPYDPSYHTGGKWRAGMGAPIPLDEMTRYNKGLDKLRELLKTKKFQKRPEYGPENEAKPSNY